MDAQWLFIVMAEGVQAGADIGCLRGTAVSRLAVAGCTEAEIATITGHALSEVRSILDKHYFSRDPALAVSAIRKLERNKKGEDFSN